MNSKKIVVLLVLLVAVVVATAFAVGKMGEDSSQQDVTQKDLTQDVSFELFEKTFIASFVNEGIVIPYANDEEPPIKDCPESDRVTLKDKAFEVNEDKSRIDKSVDITVYSPTENCNPGTIGLNGQIVYPTTVRQLDRANMKILDESETQLGKAYYYEQKFPVCTNSCNSDTRRMTLITPDADRYPYFILLVGDYDSNITFEVAKTISMTHPVVD